MAESVKRDVIVIGGSAGGIEALKQLFKDFPKDFPAAVFIVIHIWPEGKSILPDILSRVAGLPAAHPADGEPVRTGRIYVAPPDCHLMLRDSVIRVVRGPRENRHRPAIDPLFRSAASAFGNRVIGVVLTGNLNDGTAGLISIKRRGGLAIVQDPAEALYPGMPQSAIDNVRVDRVLALEEIRSFLIDVVWDRVAPSTGSPGRQTEEEIGIAMADESLVETDEHPGKPSVFACPECHGTLWELEEGNFLRFRCRVGHAYTADVLEFEMDENLERALWIAIRSLEESSSLHRRLADKAKELKLSTASRHEETASTQADSARTIRELLSQKQTQT